MNVNTTGERYRILADINMIPFIDVALVLLIIFMVMTPFLVKSQLKINLPTSKSEETPPRNEEVLDIQVDRSGAVYVNGQSVPTNTLEQALQSRIVNPLTQAVMIEADRNVPFQHVVAVLGIAKKLGVTKLGISVIREQDRESRRSGRRR